MLFPWAVRSAGGGQKPQQLEEPLAISGPPGSSLLELDDALNRVAALDQRKRPVVAQRFCGGRSVEETAEVLKVSLETAMREWRVARRGFTLK
ncbi:MAG: ECF-type sigma factor [Acidobacteriota bacterium]